MTTAHFSSRARTQRSRSAASRGSLCLAWGCFRDFLSRPCRAPPKGRYAGSGTRDRQCLALTGPIDPVPTHHALGAKAQDFSNKSASVSAGVALIVRIHGNGTDGTRHAGADLAVRLLLVVAEEHIAVIDLAVHRNDVDRTDTAFAALAVRHHLKPGLVERIQQRILLGNHDLPAGIIDPDSKRCRRQKAA